jgi:hypothetical protein
MSIDVINIWAAHWGIPSIAVEDLRIRLLPPTEPTTSGILSEANVLSRVRIEASRKGARLWRNNLGAVADSKGNFIRYGLCNDSAAINRSIKSSDLIGIRPIRLPGGQLIGQFVARECKRSDWKYIGTEREKAQLNFLTLIASFGGDACFCTGEGTI